VRGLPAETILQWWRGHPSGWWNPADWNVASVSVPIASHVTHAAGLAWGKKLRGESGVAMAFFGDGATSEGEFHEGVNLAAVMDAPAVFVCNNNQWAISTPLEAQTRAASLADKAVGYGIPGVTVDGLDVLAVYGAAREAVERARSGGGPTLIECVHYRAAPHATADDPRAYIDLARVEEERANECVGRFERLLLDTGVLTQERAAAARQDAEDLMRAGIAAAEAEPPADPELVFTHAYVDPPENMRNG
jgi:pyruvate dehydrogenase E1 component alpha subunit